MPGPQPGAPAGPPHRAAVRVTYRMTDQMGVVYYAHYMEFFEIGRTELLRAAGLAYRRMEEDGYFLPVVHAACDYLAPARYDDVLRVETRLARASRVRVDFTYEITREEGGLLICRGLTRHAVTSRDGRPRRLSESWLTRLDPAL
jgi:acyl-CoA thioester hydrolase